MHSTLTQLDPSALLSWSVYGLGLMICVLGSLVASRNGRRTLATSLATLVWALERAHLTGLTWDYLSKDQTTAVGLPRSTLIFHRHAVDYIATFGGPAPNKSGAELAAATPKDLSEIFAELDIDGNNVLDRHEVESAAMRLGFPFDSDAALDAAFAQMDITGDGGVTEEEFVSHPTRTSHCHARASPLSSNQRLDRRGVRKAASKNALCEVAIGLVTASLARRCRHGGGTRSKTAT